MSDGARLVIVGGLPGSGKTTLALSLQKQLDAVRFSADDEMDESGINLWDTGARARIEAEQWERACELLKHGRAVIVEWGSWARAERDQLRLGARALGVPVELRWLHGPIDDLWKRIRRRDREDPPITRADLDEWAELIQHPTDEERALFDPPFHVAR